MAKRSMQNLAMMRMQEKMGPVRGAKKPMMKPKSKPMIAKGKMRKVMDEWKSGMLRSGSKKGPMVTSQKQAVAIGLSEARKAGR